MLLALALTLLVAAVVVAGEALTAPARESRASLQKAVARARGRRVASRPPRPGFRARVVAPLEGRLARLALRASPRTSIDSVANRLLAAGVRGMSPTGFLGAKGGIAVGGLLVGLTLGASAGASSALGIAVALAGAGFVAPDFVLSARVRRRREGIQARLPDALDLLAVSVEAGLGFDAAVARLTEHVRGPLSEELGLTLGEMRIGRSRLEALRRLAQRVDAPEVTTFVRAVVQSEQLGISLSRILRVQAQDTRLRRQNAAEEQAMKAPVKMLFPTVLFIFPAMFIVILGPALLNFGQLF